VAELDLMGDVEANLCKCFLRDIRPVR
jgi:hypothetical protein